MFVPLNSKINLFVQLTLSSDFAIEVTVMLNFYLVLQRKLKERFSLKILDWNEFGMC